MSLSPASSPLPSSSALSLLLSPVGHPAPYPTPRRAASPRPSSGSASTPASARSAIILTPVKKHSFLPTEDRKPVSEKKISQEIDAISKQFEMLLLQESAVVQSFVRRSDPVHLETARATLRTITVTTPSTEAVRRKIPSIINASPLCSINDVQYIDISIHLLLEETKRMRQLLESELCNRVFEAFVQVKNGLIEIARADFKDTNALIAVPIGPLLTLECSSVEQTVHQMVLLFQRDAVVMYIQAMETANRKKPSDTLRKRLTEMQNQLPPLNEALKVSTAEGFAREPAKAKTAITGLYCFDSAEFVSLWRRYLTRTFTGTLRIVESEFTPLAKQCKELEDEVRGFLRELSAASYPDDAQERCGTYKKSIFTLQEKIHDQVGKIAKTDFNELVPHIFDYAYGLFMVLQTLDHTVDTVLPLINTDLVNAKPACAAFLKENAVQKAPFTQIKELFDAFKTVLPLVRNTTPHTFADHYMHSTVWMLSEVLAVKAPPLIAISDSERKLMLQALQRASLSKEQFSQLTLAIAKRIIARLYIEPGKKPEDVIDVELELLLHTLELAYRELERDPGFTFITREYQLYVGAAHIQTDILEEASTILMTILKSASPKALEVADIYSRIEELRRKNCPQLLTSYLEKSITSTRVYTYEDIKLVVERLHTNRVAVHIPEQ